METPLLNKVQTPDRLKRMDYRELERLSTEIRSFLIENISKTGGHLASNLGMVELTVALHYVFETPKDMFVFDVGHQCYTHKLLTGRKEGFAKLRQKGGLSGFPSSRESEHDIFLAGHGSTSVSAAVGLAHAKKLKNEPGTVVAIVGDGAFTGGLVYEGINNVADLDNLIIILNDNEMSISKSTGAVAQYFTRLRTSPQYYKAKNDVKSVLNKTPLIGQGLTKGIKSIKASLRRSVYHSTFFEEMGFQYIGPVDGHDIPSLSNLFVSAEKISKPLFVHVVTTKGKGFSPAERNPGAFHGINAIDAQRIADDPDLTPGESFSTVFGKALSTEANDNRKICAITAAMKYGTGLQYFKKAHLKRFFDVGMAEEHAVTFAAGLAKDGMLPVVCLYSTFLQRAYDQFIHDVMLQKLNVLFAVDRAGLVPGDGETHQGIYDAAFLSQQSCLPIVSPANYSELTFWLHKLLAEYETPRAIRYPRGEQSLLLKNKPCSGQQYDKLVSTDGAAIAIVTYGNETQEALKAAELLAEKNKAADVFQMVWINPIPAALPQELLPYQTILFAEEGIKQGGIGEHLALRLYAAGYNGSYIHIGTAETGIDHARVDELRIDNGLDAKSLTACILEEPA